MRRFADWRIVVGKALRLIELHRILLIVRLRIRRRLESGGVLELRSLRSGRDWLLLIYRRIVACSAWPPEHGVSWIVQGAGASETRPGRRRKRQLSGYKRKQTTY